MDKVEIQPHVRIPYTKIEPIALLVGDPERALQLAKLCDKFEEIVYNREYRSFSCEYKKTKFLVVSHGVGSAGASICFEELIKSGVKCLIRLGTAGSMKPDLYKTSDIVIIEAAVREDGVTKLLVPDGYPAVADIDIVNAIRSTAESVLGHKVPCGTSLTMDAFYLHDIFPNQLSLYKKINGVDIVEMEISCLFVIAKLRNVKAAAIVTLDGCPVPGETVYAPCSDDVEKNKKIMLQLGLESVVKIFKEKLYA